MPRGISDIPILRLEVLQNFIEKNLTPPELILQGMFPTTQSPSSTIKWESMEGGRGMGQFKAPGSPTPVTSPFGVAQHSAEAAFWGEKMYFDEEFLNNLRKEGTDNTYLPTAARLARELQGIINRSRRRKEWMFAKMLFAGSFSYSQQKGYKSSVDYSITSSHIVSLAAANKWNTGTSVNILGDVIDGKKLIVDDCGGKVDHVFLNSQTLRYLAMDTGIQTLLQKSTFGSGDLFKGTKNQIVGVNVNVLGSLLDIPNVVVYDELYEQRAILTAAVTGGATTTISVDDTTDFETGEALRFNDESAGTWEEETISSINAEAGTITVSTAPTASFRAGEDHVSMKRKFIPDNLFVMMASTVEGQKIAEYKEAPYGLTRGYGMKADKDELWDPEGVWIRVQDKGIPILFNRDALYILTVE